MAGFLPPPHPTAHLHTTTPVPRPHAPAPPHCRTLRENATTHYRFAETHTPPHHPHAWHFVHLNCCYQAFSSAGCCLCHYRRVPMCSLTWYLWSAFHALLPCWSLWMPLHILWWGVTVCGGRTYQDPCWDGTTNRTGTVLALPPPAHTFPHTHLPTRNPAAQHHTNPRLPYHSAPTPPTPRQHLGAGESGTVRLVCRAGTGWAGHLSVDPSVGSILFCSRVSPACHSVVTFCSHTTLRYIFLRIHSNAYTYNLPVSLCLVTRKEQAGRRARDAGCAPRRQALASHSRSCTDTKRAVGRRR